MNIILKITDMNLIHLNLKREIITKMPLRIFIISIVNIILKPSKSFSFPSEATKIIIIDKIISINPKNMIEHYIFLDFESTKTWGQQWLLFTLL